MAQRHACCTHCYRTNSLQREHIACAAGPKVTIVIGDRHNVANADRLHNARIPLIISTLCQCPLSAHAVPVVECSFGPTCLRPRRKELEPLSADTEHGATHK